jgi:hypothetical protein
MTIVPFPPSQTPSNRCNSSFSPKSAPLSVMSYSTTTPLGTDSRSHICVGTRARRHTIAASQKDLFLNTHHNNRRPPHGERVPLWPSWCTSHPHLQQWFWNEQASSERLIVRGWFARMECLKHCPRHPIQYFQTYVGSDSVIIRIDVNSSCTWKGKSITMTNVNGALLAPTLPFMSSLYMTIPNTMVDSYDRDFPGTFTGSNHERSRHLYMTRTAPPTRLNDCWHVAPITTGKKVHSDCNVLGSHLVLSKDDHTR